MGKTIHHDHYKLTSDTSGFTKGVTASKRELAEAKRVMREVESPLEKYERRSNRVGELVKKGALSQEHTNRALGKYKTELDGATKKQSRFFAVLSKHKGLIAGVFSVVTIRKFTRGVNDAFRRMDDLAKQSRTLGLGAGSLLRIQQAASLSSGLGAGQVNTGLEKFQKALSDSRQGRGVGGNRLTQLRLDAEALSKLSADQQFLRIADAIGTINDKNEQIGITQDLFGRSNAKLVETLRLGSKGIREQTGHLERRAKFLDANAAKAEKSNDAFTRLGSAWQGLNEKIAAGSSGTLGRFAEQFEKLVNDGTLPSLAKNFTDFVTVTGNLVGTLMPIVQYIGHLPATGLGQAATALGGPNATFSADPAIGKYTRIGGAGEAFLSTIMRQSNKIFGSYVGMGVSQGELRQLRFEARQGGWNDPEEARKAAARSLDHFRNHPGFKGEMEKRRQRFTEGIDSNVGPFARAGKAVGIAFFESVNNKRRELRAQKLGDAFTNFSFDSSAYDVQEQRIRARIAEREGIIQGNLGVGTRPGKTTGDLAGRDSVEAFKAQFGVGREQPVVNAIDSLRSELAQLKGELLEVQRERALAEQRKMARGLSNL